MSESASPTVLRVEEGIMSLRQRLFSVTLSAPADDLAVVAYAKDPDTNVAIPEQGSPHPSDDSLAAESPEIFAIGIRDGASGAMLATRSCFYNVKVPYVPSTPTGSDVTGDK
jgi:hypothetical protein